MRQNFIGLIALVAITSVCLCITTTSCSKKIYVTQTGDESFSSLTRITDGDNPCIAPYGGDDGKNLFYVTLEEGNRYANIFKKDSPISKSTTQKTSGKNWNTTPAYDSNTDRVAFSCKNEGSRTSDIVLMNANKGTSLTYVTDGGDAYMLYPSFSKDGNILVYEKLAYSIVNKASQLIGVLNRNILEKAEIWMRNLTTGEDIRVGRGYCPNISPDGKWIVYAQYSPEGKSCDIWKTRIDGSENIRLTDAKKGYVSHPKWSPDGRHIVFELIKKDKKDADIYIIDSDGANLTQLTKNKSYDGQPYWSNDGFVYFTSDRGNKPGNLQIWRFKIDKKNTSFPLPKVLN